MPFQKFRRAYATGEHYPLVSVHARGLFGFNTAGFEAMGEPEYVELLYDDQRKIIGIQPAEVDSVDAYRLRKHTSHSYQVAAKAFLAFYELPESIMGKRFSASMNDGILEVDISEEVSK
ncbi:hypothetical protein [Rubrobacter aplysinae]|uniref:hypothetical protein n=1 Tax=Rubrobacter aplysinae TaxID=909625 RepID=UPI00064C2609|nr:hypothetical protein [Rubrobacter aplysinae]